MSLTELSLRRPVTVTMVFVCLAVIGTLSSRLLPLEFLPEMEFPGIYVELPYRNSTPEEVERLIVRPVEEALSTLSGVKRMNSESREDGGGVFVQFDWGADLRIKGVEARDKIDAIRDSLPDELQRIRFQKFNASDQPILVLRVSANRDLADAYDMLNRNLRRRVERIQGVSRVELYGVWAKEVRIELMGEPLDSVRYQPLRHAGRLLPEEVHEGVGVSSFEGRPADTLHQGAFLLSAPVTLHQADHGVELFSSSDGAHGLEEHLGPDVGAVFKQVDQGGNTFISMQLAVDPCCLGLELPVGARGDEVGQVRRNHLGVLRRQPLY